MFGTQRKNRRQNKTNNKKTLFSEQAKPNWKKTNREKKIKPQFAKVEIWFPITEK